MDIVTYLGAIRAQWRLVVGVALVALLVALGAALAEPPRYTATAHLLIVIAQPTRPPAPGTPGMVDIEDALAYDVPAIVRGQPFAADVASSLASLGLTLHPDDVARALSATNQKREVWLSATSTDPAAALAIARTAVTVLQTGGLRYWDGGAPTAERPGLTVVALDAPGAARRVNGPAAMARSVALRALAGLAVGLTLAGVGSYRALAGNEPGGRSGG
jgi:hypothetical protein